MTQLPIPDDWNGQDWRCVRVQWPNSPMWSAILVGLLTQPKRGRLWRADSGTITDAQDIGTEIFARNYPYVVCEDCAPSETKTIIERVYIDCGPQDCEDCDTGECDEMSCSIPYGSLRWQDGKLQYRYCGDWYDVEGSGITAETPPIDDEYTPPEGATYSACGKASAIVDLMLAVGTVIWDQRDNDPVTAWSNINSAFPGIMSMGWSINAAIAAFDVDALEYASGEWYGPELFDESTWQSILCQFSNTMSDTADLPDKDTLFETLIEIIDRQWPIDLLAQSFWYNVGRAIGENDLRNQGLLGATNTSADCRCPEVLAGEMPPVAGDWYLSSVRQIDIAITSVKEDSYTNVNEIAEHHIYGLFMWCEVLSLDGDFERWSKSSSTGGAAFDHNLTEHGGTATYYISQMRCQMDDTPATTLYDALEASAAATGKSKNLDTLGARSKIVDSPIASAGDAVQASYFGEMQNPGDTGAIRVFWRLIYNAGDSSHV